MKTPKVEKRAKVEEGYEPVIVKVGPKPEDYGTPAARQESKAVKSGENLLRASYLYQLAAMFRKKHKPLARMYAKEMKLLAERHVIRLHPGVKHSVCRHCYMLNVPEIDGLKKPNRWQKPKWRTERCDDCKEDSK